MTRSRMYQQAKMIKNEIDDRNAQRKRQFIFVFLVLDFVTTAPIENFVLN